MFLLTFRVADNLYAADVARVVEVVPRVDLRPLPHAPAFLVGLFEYRGGVVPVVDLGLLLGQVPCRDRLSTRIILVSDSADDHNDERRFEEESPDDHGGRPRQGRGRRARRRLLGLIAEHVSDVVPVSPEQVIFPAMSLPQAPYLGAIVQIDHQGMAQLITAEKVLDESLRTALFGGKTAEAGLA